ncbi:hypothetical protein D931_03724 [Enterococcus faecium 13.SD.W.09]|nr:hypothetical protein D931_03724 [Enterococcus faecium 13.SD.W.09]
MLILLYLLLKKTPFQGKTIFFIYQIEEKRLKQMLLAKLSSD